MIAAETPLNDYVLIELEYRDSMTKEGIRLTDEMQMDTKIGKVLAVSPDLKTTSIKEGSRVRYRENTGVKLSSSEYERNVLISYFDLFINIDTDTPLNDYVLMKPYKKAAETEDGFVLPEEMRSVSGIGEVVAVSSDLKKVKIKKGDIVMHRKKTERNTDEEDISKEYLTLYKNVMAVLKNQ